MTHVFKDGVESNRFFNIEDQSMGFWMLAHNVTYFDDRRLCASTCHSSHAFVAVNNGAKCTGMVNPFVELPAVDALTACHVSPPEKLPFVKSDFSRFNTMIEAKVQSQAHSDRLVIRNTVRGHNRRLSL